MPTTTTTIPTPSTPMRSTLVISPALRTPAYCLPVGLVVRVVDSARQRRAGAIVRGKEES